MKNLFFYTKGIFGAALFMVVFLSCKKSFLEVTPKGKLIAQTVSDYDLLLNNTSLLNTGASAQLVLGDEIAAVEPYYSSAELRTHRLFQWEDVVYEANENATEMQVPMQNVYTYNKIINEVPDARDGSEQQKKSIQAEAMAGRAWTYFLLINFYGKPYQSTTAVSDPGFPIVTASDVTETSFSRASVKEVYDFIINDLVTALPHLPVKATNRLRMSRGAAKGLLGKVLLFMGKPSEALPYLNEAITDMATSTMPVQLFDYNKTLAPGGSFTPFFIFGPQYPTVDANVECFYGKQFSNFWVLSSELVLHPNTVALYQPSDLRLQFFSGMPYPSGPQYPAGMLRRMGPVTIQYGVVVPDLYLLRAECKARLNDLPGAVMDVETLRKNRMPAADAPVPLGIADQPLALLNFILEERIREFASLGYRWFDMRRLSVDPLFSGISFYHTYYDANGTPAVISLKPERLVLRFPQKVLDQNPGMVNNP
jgi:starch-binding outer membrane protein, SusD/RagB family